MLHDFEIIKIFSLVLATAHLSNTSNKKATVIVDKKLNIVQQAYNTELFTTIEKLILKSKHKNWNEFYIFTNDLFCEKQLNIIHEKGIKKIFLITPNDEIKEQDIKTFTDTANKLQINIEFISLSNKKQLLLNITKDQGIDFKDSKNSL